MKQLLCIITCCIFFVKLSGQPPVFIPGKEKSVTADWLIITPTQKAAIYQSKDTKDIILYNGLVKRIFRLSPNLVCTDYTNMITGQQLLRTVQPEALVNINGADYAVGGLHGTKEKAYFKQQWLNSLTTDEKDFRLVDYVIAEVKPFLDKSSAIPRNWWTPQEKNSGGKTISFRYTNALPHMKGIEIRVNYAIYDGLPLVAKWVTVENKSQQVIRLDRVKSEILAVVEEESAVVGGTEQMRKQHGIYFETNYAFNNAMRYDISDQTTHWKADSTYTSQVNYNYKTPSLVEIYPEKAPGIELYPGKVFQSPRTYELLMDSYDRERNGMAIRKMYRTIAPWVKENPIFMHLVSKNDAQVRDAVDQCAATGYEALILSFGSHINMEDSSADNIRRWKENAAYAHSKGIKIGGYSLFSSRRISDEDDVIDPKTGKPGGAFFGHAPCFGSKWGLAYRDKIKYFFEQTGFDIWENDGPYPGDVCASANHPGHKGLDDSQWKQMEIQKDLYHWLNEQGIYINAPDWYFLDGTNKTGIGYREVNFSLPRENQKILNRQNIFDGTWEKTPSMGWGFVPLTRYQGGGSEAVLEPLADHLEDYKQLMMQYYGAGVQACYRGPRLYDTDTTKQVVIDVISWYKKYRDILNSDIIHLRRADGRDWDGILHVNPSLQQKGLLMLYNPTHSEITRTIQVPLYYTGLETTARIREKEGAPKTYTLNRNYEVTMTVKIPADSYSWWVFE